MGCLTPLPGEISGGSACHCPRRGLLVSCKLVNDGSADPEHLVCLFRMKLIKVEIKNSTAVCQDDSSGWLYDWIVFITLLSRQAFFSFVSRFNLGDVEKSAESVKTFLEIKQQSRRPLKADKEAYDMENKLRKLRKSLETQKTMWVCDSARWWLEGWNTSQVPPGMYTGLHRHLSCPLFAGQFWASQNCVCSWLPPCSRCLILMTLGLRCVFPSSHPPILSGSLV